MSDNPDVEMEQETAVIISSPSADASSSKPVSSRKRRIEDEDEEPDEDGVSVMRQASTPQSLAQSKYWLVEDPAIKEKLSLAQTELQEAKDKLKHMESLLENLDTRGERSRTDAEIQVEENRIMDQCQINVELAEDTSKLKEKVDDLEKNLDSEREGHDAAMKELQQHHNAAIEKLRFEHETTEKSLLGTIEKVKETQKEELRTRYESIQKELEKDVKDRDEQVQLRIRNAQRLGHKLAEAKNNVENLTNLNRELQGQNEDLVTRIQHLEHQASNQDSDDGKGPSDEETKTGKEDKRVTDAQYRIAQLETSYEAERERATTAEAQKQELQRKLDEAQTNKEAAENETEKIKTNTKTAVERLAEQVLAVQSDAQNSLVQISAEKDRLFNEEKRKRDAAEVGSKRNAELIERAQLRISELEASYQAEQERATTIKTQKQELQRELNESKEWLERAKEAAEKTKASTNTAIEHMAEQVLAMQRDMQISKEAQAKVTEMEEDMKQRDQELVEKERLVDQELAEKEKLANTEKKGREVAEAECLRLAGVLNNERLRVSRVERLYEAERAKATTAEAQKQELQRELDEAQTNKEAAENETEKIKTNTKTAIEHLAEQALAVQRDAQISRAQISADKDHLVNEEKRKRDAAEAESKRLAELLDSEHVKTVALERLNAEAKTHMEKMQKKIDEAKLSDDALEGFRREKEAAQQVTTNLRSTIHNLEAQVLEFELTQPDHEAIKADRDKLIEELKRSKARCTDLEEKNGSLQGIIASNAGSIDEERIKALQKANSTIRSELAKEKAANLSSSRELDEARTSIQKLQSDKQLLTESIEKHQAQISSNVKQDEEIQSLKRQLEEEKQTNSQLRKGKQREQQTQPQASTSSSDTATQTPATDDSSLDPAALFLAVRRFGKTLKEVNVLDELAWAKTQGPSYKLSKAIPIPPTLASSPTLKPWSYMKPSKYQKAPRSRGDDGTSDIDDDLSTDGDDDDEGSQANSALESDQSRLFLKYRKMGAQQRKKDPKRVRNEINKLGRDVIQEAMHARHSKEAWARSAVPPERLKLFLEDSRAHAPKVRNTWLDKAGKTTTKELRESSWNQALIHKLALLLKDIVAQCPDKTRFGNGNIDWKALVSNRFDQIYLDIVQSVPRNEAETRSPAMIQARLEMRNLEKNIANGAVTIRNAKYHARMNIAANMAGYQREKKDANGIEFWDYVLKVTYALGHDGMSDEEDGFETITSHPSGLQSKRRIKKVLVLPWRHPSLRPLFEKVDSVPQLEELIFKQTGKHARLQRIRVAQLSTRRSIPKNLHRSFFRDGYLDSLMEHELDRLVLAEEDFTLHEFQFDDLDYRYPADATADVI